MMPIRRIADTIPNTTPTDDDIEYGGTISEIISIYISNFKFYIKLFLK